MQGTETVTIQTMFGLSLPSLLALGFSVAVVLLMMGYRETQLPNRANALFRAGLILLGVMIALTPILWYSTWALPSGNLLMTLSDIFVLGLGALFGGIVVGAGFLFRLRK